MDSSADGTASDDVMNIEWDITTGAMGEIHRMVSNRDHYVQSLDGIIYATFVTHEPSAWTPRNHHFDVNTIEEGKEWIVAQMVLQRMVG